MNKKKTIKERFKGFVNDNKKQIYICAGGLLLCAGGYFSYKFGNKSNKNTPLPELRFVPESSHKFKNIDEEIFTFIAPNIEEALLDPHRTEWQLRSCFDIGGGLQKTLDVVVSEAEEII